MSQGDMPASLGCQRPEDVFATMRATIQGQAICRKSS